MRSLRRRAERREPPVTRAPVARDPSPSLWAYRMHRLWLTPIYRRLFRVGMPAAVFVLFVGWFVADDARMQAITAGFDELRRTVEERPEFMVAAVAIDGASPELADAVRAALPLTLPLSSFDLDLELLRQGVEALDAVERARLRIRPGGVLEVAIDERRPAVLWRAGAALTLLDATGHRVALAADRAEWPDLGLIAGAGADGAVPEALALIEATGPLRPRLRGLVRMGDRRWDVVLDRGQRILLPEREAIPALERLVALHEARDMLDRDIAIVDLRNPRRPTLRLGGFALSELVRVGGLEAEGTTQ